jgi:hypothetical protein
MPHDLDFWKETFRDVLREVVRVEGIEVLREAPRIAALARGMADEADLAMHQAINRPPLCGVCRGLRFVFDEGDSVGKPCPQCNAGRTDPAPDDETEPGHRPAALGPAPTATVE